MTELEQKMAAPGFWDNQEEARPVVARLKTVKAIVTPVTEMISRIEDLQVHYELAVEENSEEEFREVAQGGGELQADLERLELRTLLSGPHDAGPCFFSIHAGAGGTESCDWAEMLLRMYMRYFERHGYAAEEVDRTDGEEAGIRSITLRVTGPYAYGYLACERGVHRLVRISPFDSQNRRHTSFASVNVLPELEDVDIEIDWDKDVREDTYRASGAGGQHVPTQKPGCGKKNARRETLPGRASQARRRTCKTLQRQGRNRLRQPDQIIRALPLPTGARRKDRTEKPAYRPHTRR